MIEIKTHQVISPTDPTTGKMAVTAIFNPLDQLSDRINQDLIREVVRQIAERYVSENYSHIVAKLDQQAIANLVVAESGKKIAEEIRLTPGRMNIDNSRTVNERKFSLF